MLDYVAYNRSAWDSEVEKGCRWTIPVSTEEVQAARDGEWGILVTPRKHIPREWFPDLVGKNVLCLASGGGQQGPILAAAGANVTVFDNSPRQLERDGQVAQRESLSIRLELGDMQDLSRFQNGEYELIIANGLGCVKNIRSVWNQCYRVLADGGIMISGGQNPIEFVFDLREWNKGNLVARHRIPYSDARDLDEKERFELLVDGAQPMFFGHSIEDQLQGQLSAGFIITGFFEDNSGEANPLDRFIDMYFGIRSIKPLHLDPRRGDWIKE